jgi:hypothetical protein
MLVPGSSGLADAPHGGGKASTGAPDGGLGGSSGGDAGSAGGCAHHNPYLKPSFVENLVWLASAPAP